MPKPEMMQTALEAMGALMGMFGMGDVGDESQVTRCVSGSQQ
jgi:hypothetical protein